MGQLKRCIETNLGEVEKVGTIAKVPVHSSEVSHNSLNLKKKPADIYTVKPFITTHIFIHATADHVHLITCINCITARWGIVMLF